MRIECDKPTLWKRILKAQHPDFPLGEVDNYENVVLELSEKALPSPQINDFDFYLTIYDGDRKIGTEKCTFQPNERWQVEDENLKAHLLRILKREAEPGVLKLKCYVILDYQGTKQFRTRDFEFNFDDWQSPYAQILEFTFTDCNFCDIRFYKENGLVSVSISVFTESDISPNEVEFFKHFKDLLSFNY